jgi:hypothetical protein
MMIKIYVVIQFLIFQSYFLPINNFRGRKFYKWGRVVTPQIKLEFNLFNEISYYFNTVYIFYLWFY